MAIPMAPAGPRLAPGQLRNHAMVVLGTAHPGKPGAQPGYQIYIESWVSNH